MNAECPVCGYDPNPQIVKKTDAELRSQRIRNCFSINLMNTWWLTQPEYICDLLNKRRQKDVPNICPKTILDVGCGDGRWAPGILKTWPEVDYTGIDVIAEHIEDNRERMPELRWVQKKIEDYNIYGKPIDLALLGGTLQERGRLVETAPILDAARAIGSKWIIVLLDKNVPMESHTPFIEGYSCLECIPIPADLSGPRQENVLHVYLKSEILMSRFPLLQRGHAKGGK